MQERLTAYQLRERLAGCRANRAIFAAIKTPARWTYRAINATLYHQYKQRLLKVETP